jgi:hypothetical protein
MMILTRLLYNKNDVFIILLISLLEKDKERTLYWAFELYHSGFEIELFEFLLKVYREYYQKYNPKFKRYFLMKYEQWRCIKQQMTFLEKERIVSSILLNLLFRSYKENNNKESVFVLVSVHSHTYFLPKVKDIKPYLTLQKHCLFGINDNEWLINYHLYIKNMELIDEYICKEENNYINDLFNHWEYYCYFCTFWKKRIQEFKGYQNHSLKKIEFLNGMYEDEFYEKYNMEPDEQNRETIIKLIG